MPKKKTKAKRAAKEHGREKPIVGFYSVTGCQGCLLSVLFNEDEFFDLAASVNIAAFPFIKEKQDSETFDIIFFEGVISSKQDEETAKKLREKTKILVALGACSCTGCIPAFKNFLPEENFNYLQYEKLPEIGDVRPQPLLKAVQVDYSIPGCPPSKEQIKAFIKEILLDKKPRQYEEPVCFECRLNGNSCLLEEKRLCLGPITKGGCNAICVNGNFECWGCRGPTNDYNLEAFKKLLTEKGFSEKEIEQRMQSFVGMEWQKIKEDEVQKAIAQQQRETTVKKEAQIFKKEKTKIIKKTAKKKAVKLPKKKTIKKIKKKTR